MPDANDIPGIIDFRSVYLRWIGANMLAEFVGLGASLALGAALFAVNDGAPLGRALLLALATALLSALIEGTAVGGLQWRVLRGPLTELSARRYIIATAAGAFVAWSLGMLPSTIMASMVDPAAQSAEVASFDPALWLQLLLAAGMGLVLGPILGVPQWYVLKEHLPRAGQWILANSVAWGCGMPMIFLATGFITEESATWQIALAIGLGVLGAGIVVGAVHGLWLIRMLKAKQE